MAELRLVQLEERVGGGRQQYLGPRTWPPA